MLEFLLQQPGAAEIAKTVLDKDGYTALELAAAEGQTAGVGLLLDATCSPPPVPGAASGGEETGAVDDGGGQPSSQRRLELKTAFELAVQRGHAETVWRMHTFAVQHAVEMNKKMTSEAGHKGGADGAAAVQQECVSRSSAGEEVRGGMVQSGGESKATTYLTPRSTRLGSTDAFGEEQDDKATFPRPRRQWNDGLLNMFTDWGGDRVV